MLRGLRSRSSARSINALAVSPCNVGIIFTGVAIILSPLLFRGQNYIKYLTITTILANFFPKLFIFVDFSLSVSFIMLLALFHSKTYPL